MQKDSNVPFSGSADGQTDRQSSKPTAGVRSGQEEEEEGTFLKERAGRAGGRSLTWWWKASKCIDRCCPTRGDTAGLRAMHTHTHTSDQRRRGGGGGEEEE